MVAVNTLVDHYDRLERRWKIVDRVADYSRLVVPNGNHAEPIHRWFHLKEAYSSHLLGRLFKDADWQPEGQLRVVDPFSGGGTTLVSALSLASQYDATPTLLGVEQNPLLRIISAAKVQAAIQGQELARKVASKIPSVVTRYEDSLQRKSWSTASSTLNNPKYFPSEHLAALLALRNSIDLVSDEDVRLVLMACLAASVEPSGRLRRDGRALRHEPDRKPQHPQQAFEAIVRRVLADLVDRPASPEDWVAAVVPGDARRTQDYVEDEEFDWIVFSPPYPNNIDYTEVYKVEAWTLGIWRDSKEMRSQRLSTVRSHPSVRFPDEYSYESRPDSSIVDDLLNPLLDAIPSDRYSRGRRQIVRGYADDLLQVFESCRNVVSPTGRLVYVVGNSMHGSHDNAFVIAADLILARLAELAGWVVEEIRVARKPRRRSADAEHLRESVVILRPNALT